MSSFVESGGGVVGAVGLPSVNNIHYFLIKELSILFDNTHMVKSDLAPKLCLWTFINLTFCESFQSFMQKNSRHLLRNWL